MDLPVGAIRAGCLADILLVTGDPTEDVTILQDKANLATIMKGGRFHTRPAASQH
jgi:imidazolonepropionase-like amidohydrolase